VSIAYDSAGNVQQNVPKRHHLSGTYTPTVSGLYTLDIYNHYNGNKTQFWTHIDDITLAPQTPALSLDTPNISVATGGSVQLALDAGASHANEDYFVLMSFGVHPGFDANGVHVPLNMDYVFNYSKTHANSSVFQNTMGVLNGSGQASAAFDTIGPVDSAYLGTQLYCAYILLAGQLQPPVTFASNHVIVNFVP